MTGNGGGAGIEPIVYVLEKCGNDCWERPLNAEEGEDYQSIDCGGSSLEGEVLTVSTQPKHRNLGQLASFIA